MKNEEQKLKDNLKKAEDELLSSPAFKISKKLDEFFAAEAALREYEGKQASKKGKGITF